MVIISMVRHPGALPIVRQAGEKHKMKIRCLKAECPSCKQSGSIQLFLNKNGEVGYARTRHYSHLDKDTKKPQFTYCKIEDLEALKTLLSQQGVSLSAVVSQIGQGQSRSIHDLKVKESSFKSEKEAGPLGFEPRTFSLEG